jgi:putative hydrolase of the HAD superfamily
VALDPDSAAGPSYPSRRRTGAPGAVPAAAWHARGQGFKARKAGIRVGVITNSWGTEPCDPYEGYQFNERYDALVVSSEVGVRKPDPAIYRLAADKLGITPSRCVFVDDVAANLPPAAELGMATILYVDSSRTIVELRRILGVPLAS